MKFFALWFSVFVIAFVLIYTHPSKPQDPHVQICGYQYTIWLPNGNVSWHTNKLWAYNGQLNFENGAYGWVSLSGSWAMYDYGGPVMNGCKP